MAFEVFCFFVNIGGQWKWATQKKQRKKEWIGQKKQGKGVPMKNNNLKIIEQINMDK